MGKSTINWQFSIAMLNYQRVIRLVGAFILHKYDIRLMIKGQHKNILRNFNYFHLISLDLSSFLMIVSNCVRFKYPLLFLLKYLVGAFNHLEKYESQWEGWHPIYYGKRPVPNHQSDIVGHILWGYSLKFRPWTIGLIYGSRYLQSIGSWNGHWYVNQLVCWWNLQLVKSSSLPVKSSFFGADQNSAVVKTWLPCGMVILSGNPEKKIIIFMTWSSSPMAFFYPCPDSQTSGGLLFLPMWTQLSYSRWDDFSTKPNHFRDVTTWGQQIPSGYVKIAIANSPFIVDLSIENGDFHSYVSLPEGNSARRIPSPFFYIPYRMLPNTCKSLIKRMFFNNEFIRIIIPIISPEYPNIYHHVCWFSHQF